jgi:tRNA pseudouridine38-40 synthase
VRTIKLTLAYDGTRYVGWQRQAEGASIQGLLEDALAEIDGEVVPVVGAGRTDAGVHALGQVASFHLRHPMPVETLVRALNARLPEDVRALRAEEAEPGFHARYSARAKTYRYRLSIGAAADPFGWRFLWQVPTRLDQDAMRQALSTVVGRHDFASFQGAGSSVRTTVRTVTTARVLPAPSGSDGSLAAPALGAPVLHVEITADGFLRHMVRTIVGTVVEVGQGRRTPTDVAEALAARDRARAGPTAPARGLFLVGVDYGTAQVGYHEGLHFHRDPHGA